MWASTFLLYPLDHAFVELEAYFKSVFIFYINIGNARDYGPSKLLLIENFTLSFIKYHLSFFEFLYFCIIINLIFLICLSQFVLNLIDFLLNGFICLNLIDQLLFVIFLSEFWVSQFSHLIFFLIVKALVSSNQLLYSYISHWLHIILSQRTTHTNIIFAFIASHKLISLIWSLYNNIFTFIAFMLLIVFHQTNLLT